MKIRIQSLSLPWTRNVAAATPMWSPSLNWIRMISLNAPGVCTARQACTCTLQSHGCDQRLSITCSSRSSPSQALWRLLQVPCAHAGRAVRRSEISFQDCPVHSRSLLQLLSRSGPPLYLAYVVLFRTFSCTRAGACASFEFVFFRVLYRSTHQTTVNASSVWPGLSCPRRCMRQWSGSRFAEPQRARRSLPRCSSSPHFYGSQSTLLLRVAMLFLVFVFPDAISKSLRLC